MNKQKLLNALAEQECNYSLISYILAGKGARINCKFANMSRKDLRKRQKSYERGINKLRKQVLNRMV